METEESETFQGLCHGDAILFASPTSNPRLATITKLGFVEGGVASLVTPKAGEAYKHEDDQSDAHSKTNCGRAAAPARAS
jgi:hypothetical protein